MHSKQKFPPPDSRELDDMTTTTFANPVYEHADALSSFEEVGSKFETIETGKRYS